MGSTIGDYVHYHAKNYLKWGTNQVGEEGSSASNAMNVFNQQKTKIKTSMQAIQNLSMTPSERLELEQRLMNLMRPPQDSQEADFNELWNALVPYFEAEFADGVGRIRRDTANVYAIATIPELTKIKTQKGNMNILTSTIVKRISAIYNAFIKAAQGTVEKRYLQKLLDDIDSEFDKISKIGRQNFTDMSSPGLSNAFLTNNQKITLQQAQPVIDLINRAAAAASGTVNLQKGTLFEDMIAIAPFLGKKLTMQELQNAIKESVVGTTGKSSVTFDPQMFMTGLDMQSILGNNYRQDINDQLWKTITTSQDKVDVQLNWRGDGSRINISAKNVNLGTNYTKGVHLVSSMSLLAALSTLDNIDFVNHYLNINSSTFKGGVNGMSGSIYNSAKLALNISILEEAFRGYKGPEKAEVFVINDNQTGSVKVFDIPTLILKVIESSKEIIDEAVSISPDLGALTFPNYWMSTVRERIAHLLAGVNRYKIDVVLQPQFFAS